MTEARRYTKTHEWIAPANVQGEWNVGITDFAQEEVTDVVFVELPKVGRSVPRGEKRPSSSPSRQPFRFMLRLPAQLSPSTRTSTVIRDS